MVSDISSAVLTITRDEPFPLSGTFHPVLFPNVMIFGGGERKKSGIIKQHLSAHCWAFFNLSKHQLLNGLKSSSLSREMFRPAGDCWKGQDMTGSYLWEVTKGLESQVSSHNLSGISYSSLSPNPGILCSAASQCHALGPAPSRACLLPVSPRI